MSDMHRPEDVRVNNERSLQQLGDLSLNGLQGTAHPTQK
ncbi:hypothetical protein NIES4073_20300 [Kalymmatonema gypsitolerans NIES-4073]|nr:hypothetical protein NIES4073_20300 [Scytonema sp. NIES-4073]